MADFLVFYDGGEIDLVDVKGMLTSEFKIKQKLMATHFPHIPLRVVLGKDVPRG